MKRPKNFVSGQALVKIFGHLSMHGFTLYCPFLISNSGLRYPQPYCYITTYGPRGEPFFQQSVDPKRTATKLHLNDSYEILDFNT